ncbi:MAG: diaminopimelate epimerase [Bacteroidia bacterium]|nr:diaminopimelate epimerase [Bacteroidia bacterium]MCO5253120.1 diaminopimelate epimerase [Bacteroidota bacterium]MCZ2130560.1 diaminopimelate epimerase [Bacteroidia bacterium]
MKIDFYKYQGTGNDFVIIDNRFKQINKLPVKQICDRRFGIGADGLMLLEQLTGYDFKMVYYNSDGNESTMCGNGGRCLAAFAHKMGLGKNEVLNFLAIDGEHQALIMPQGIVSLQMNDVNNVLTHESDLVLDTGSPHYVRFVEDVHSVNLVTEAHKVRYAPEYKDKGINVNFVHILNDNEIAVRTYERGVEDETLSCGTGVTACALAQSENAKFGLGQHEVSIHTPGGKLSVSFNKTSKGYDNIRLIGPAVEVFSGVYHY